MSLPWIVKGDKTSHGGTVIEGDPTTDIDGKLVARVGDKVTCPKCKGGPFPIVTGAADLIIGGSPVARHGDKTACGASLISGQVRTTWGAQGSDGSGTPLQFATYPAFDEKVKFAVDGSPDNMIGLPYFIETKDGRTYSGYVQDKGELSRIHTDGPGSYTVYWGDEALERMQAWPL